MKYLQAFDARYFLTVYLEWRKTGNYPNPGNMGAQPAFTIDLFNHLDVEFDKQATKNSNKTK